MMKATAVLWTVCAGEHYLGNTSEASWRKAFSLSTRQEEKNIKAPTESNSAHGTARTRSATTTSKLAVPVFWRGKQGFYTSGMLLTRGEDLRESFLGREGKYSAVV
ncbi:unnamed protein product [Peronospora farinosa]|uniref:Secreted protein n=1 Tax=Peronospora farinosa TaxID=134698 RepID=A0AAV0SQU0_9STRA|nr:unnamed protein product [Peronospora farinosa]